MTIDKKKNTNATNYIELLFRKWMYFDIIGQLIYLMDCNILFDVMGTYVWNFVNQLRVSRLKKLKLIKVKDILYS